jgi:hypothetical protein
MNQTASADQTVLRHHRECGQDSNMDRHHRLRLGCHREKTPQYRGFAIYHPTVLSLTLFEKTPLDQLLKNTEIEMTTQQNNTQMNLFN